MLPVQDMNRARDFYCSVLGFHKTFENGTPVQFMILKRDEAELHLTLQLDHMPPGFNVAHLLVEDAIALHDACVTHGCAIIKPLKDQDYGLRAFVFEDTEGNRIDVGEPI